MFRQNSQDCLCKQTVSAMTTPVRQYDLVSTMLVLGISRHQMVALMDPS
jgi:hypothetical protein